VVATRAARGRCRARRTPGARWRSRPPSSSRDEADPARRRRGGARLRRSGPGVRGRQSPSRCPHQREEVVGPEAATQHEGTSRARHRRVAAAAAVRRQSRAARRPREQEQASRASAARRRIPGARPRRAGGLGQRDVASHGSRRRRYESVCSRRPSQCPAHGRQHRHANPRTPLRPAHELVREKASGSVARPAGTG